MSHQFKRETSVSVDDLHTLSENIKRVAISVDGKAYNQNTTTYPTNKVTLPPNPISIPSSVPTPPPALSLKMPDPTNSAMVTSIMSSSKVNFSELYKVVDEIGRGGFSTVYRCINRSTENIYAVKVKQMS